MFSLTLQANVLPLHSWIHDTNIDNVDNITIILAVHDYIKNSGFSTTYLLIYNVCYFQILCKSTILGMSLYWWCVNVFAILLTFIM